jgi:predicted dehydrogenase
MLRGAIIGVGKIAETGHFPAYIQSSKELDIEIIALVDKSEERLECAKRYFPQANIYNSIEELFADKEVDFVDICLPPFLHKEAIEKCAAKNIHILCEKPLCSDYKDLKEISEALEDKDIVFMPCHQYKYAPVWKEFIKAAETINEKKIFLQFNVIRLNADNGFDNANPNWRTDSKLSGGGISVDTGAHYFYLIKEILGVPYKLFANLYNLKHKDYNAEDSAFITVDMEKGIAQINLTWAGCKRYNSAMLICDELSLFYDGKSIRKIQDGEESIIDVPDMSDKRVYASLYSELIKDFTQRINSRNFSNEGLEEVALVMNMLEMTKQSNFYQNSMHL